MYIDLLKILFMKSLYLFFLLSFLLSFGQDSEKKADSLKTILNKKTLSYQERIEVLDNLTKYYGEFDFDQATTYNNQIYSLSKKKNYTKGFGFYFQNRADYSIRTNEFKNAEKLAKTAQAYFLKAKDNNNYLLSIYANCFALDFQENYKAARELALKAVSQYEHKPNNDYIVELYYYLSTLYNDERKAKTAFLYVNKALDFYVKKKNDNGIFKCNYQLASIASLSGMYAKSIGYLDKCSAVLKSKFNHKIEYNTKINKLYADNYIKMGQFRKALVYCKIVQENSKKVDFQYISFDNNLAFATIYLKLKQFNLASKYITKLDNANNLSESEQFQLNYLKGSYFLATNNFQEAYVLGLKNYSIDSLDTQNLELLSKVTYALKDYKKAFNYQTLVLQENLKEYKMERDNQVVEYEALFQLKDKNLTIKNKNIQVVKKETEVQRQKGYVVVFLVTSLALLTVFILLGYNFQIKKKSLHLLYLKNEELSRLNELIAASLKEKDILLKEIHHRVKNNLQLVMSLLNIQAQDSQHISIQDFLEKGQSRIATMSLIHQNLYLSDNFAHIDFQTYLETLVSNIKNTFNENKVAIAIDTHGNTFDLDTAIPLGLIINEIVCNALKHAFPENMQGQIQIAIQKKETNFFELQIGDNGVGMQQDKKTNSIGLELVSLLVLQLRGKMEKINKTGTYYNIQFHPSIE